MRALSASVALALSCAVFACGSTAGDDSSGAYDSIAIEPPVVTLTVPLGGTATQAYTIYGVNGDTKKDITASCAIGLEDTSFGNFVDANLTAFPRGGKTNVIAACLELQASAPLIVNLTGDVIGPGAPGNAKDMFDNATAATDPAKTPKIEYPLDQAVSPRNIPPIEVQWVKATNDLFHITIKSSFAAINIYTIDAESMLTAADWTAVASTAAGENLSFVVEGLLQANPAMKYTSTPNVVTMSTDTIDQTAIYWWSSNQGNILTQQFGKVDAPELVKDDCTSCHSVSRAGTRIGYSRCVAGDCGKQALGFLKYDVTTAKWVETVDANNLGRRGSYSTFAPVGNPYPTDDQALAMVNLRGNLELVDPDTGANVPSNIAVANVGGMSAMMPDWSPDGTKVTFAQGGAGQFVDISGGKIAVMSYNYAAAAHVFGTPTTIVQDPIVLPSGTFANFFFPSFSPDSELIVFNATKGPWRSNASDGRLMLTTPTGAYTVDLTAMNGGDAANGITWPHWAPNVTNDYYWVAMSSERDYGHRTTAATSPAGCKASGVRQCKQIWLGAIAKNKLGAGMDPSSPPMWMPGQEPLTNNLSPYWTKPTVIQ